MFRLNFFSMNSHNPLLSSFLGICQNECHRLLSLELFPNYLTNASNRPRSNFKWYLSSKKLTCGCSIELDGNLSSGAELTILTIRTRRRSWTKAYRIDWALCCILIASPLFRTRERRWSSSELFKFYWIQWNLKEHKDDTLHSILAGKGIRLKGINIPINLSNTLSFHNNKSVLKWRNPCLPFPLIGKKATPRSTKTLDGGSKLNARRMAGHAQKDTLNLGNTVAFLTHVL